MDAKRRRVAVGVESEQRSVLGRRWLQRGEPVEITEVKIFLVDEEKLRAFVSIVIDQCFMINDIKVIQGREGLFISMPSRRKKNGEFKDVAHPLNNETRSWMEERILSEYERLRAARETKVDEQPEADTTKANGQGGAVAPAAVVTESPAVAAAPLELAKSSESGSEERLSDVAREHLSDSYWSVS